MTSETPLARSLIIAAPSSGSGKTTVTLGLLRHFRDAGLAVSSAKVGPDFLDPQFHALASGRACWNLDPWGMRPGTISVNLNAAGAGTALTIVEGVMGLFDGATNDAGSTADLAAQLNLPIVLVADASAQAQSAAAVVHGFHTFRDCLRIAGVIFNQVGGAGHAALLRRAMEPLRIPVLGAIPRHPEIQLPERHLGLVQPGEDPDINRRFDRIAEWVGQHIDAQAFLEIAAVPSVVATIDAAPVPPLGRRIAVASDVAFAFTYPHLVENWRKSGAEIMRFSPLADEPPDVAADAIYLPGGYPELHAARLAGNHVFLEGLRKAAKKGVTIYGECGGYMVLGAALIDADGTRHRMADLLPLEVSFADKRLHLGYRTLEMSAASPFGSAGTRLRMHEFHFSTIVHEQGAEALGTVWDAEGVSIGEVGLRRGSVMGSFLHLIDFCDA